MYQPDQNYSQIPPQAPQPKSKLPLILMILGGGLLCILVMCIASFAALTLMGNQVSEVFEEIEVGLEQTASASPNNPVGLPTRVPQATRTVESDGIVSNDGNFQITRPGSMVNEDSLNADASLQIADLRAEQYLIVIPDDAATLNELGYNFADYEDLISSQIAEALEEGSIDDTYSVTIDGLSGNRYEVSGIIDDLEITYWVTLLEGEDTYYQILTWTLTERAERNRGILLDASDSFQRIK